MIHARRFLTALTFVLACYGLYTFACAPWLEPPPIARKAPSSDSDADFRSAGATRDFAGLFEPGSWELDNPKIVENPDCTLLIQDYNPLDDGRMELRPCTLIFYMPADPAEAVAATAANPLEATPVVKRRPVVLRAPEGAILQFDRPLDLSKAQFGRLVGGRLAGEITIFSPPSKPNANDALRLTTRNVQIDTERAFTPHDVEFQYGSSYGRGRDMTIFLLPKEDATGGKSSSPIGGVRALQLAHVEKLHLEMDSPGLLPSPNSSAAAPMAPTKPSPPLEIRCKGPLVYDFEQKIAAVDDQVEVSRVYPGGPPDRLLCSRLMLYMAAPTRGLAGDDKLASPAPGAVAATTVAAQPANKDITSRLHRLVAVGSPVVLEAPSSSTFVVASRVEYSPPTRRLMLESGEGAQQVVLERDQDKFEARTLEYEMAPEGQRLGRLWAAGPGRLRLTHLQDGQPQTISAQWQKELLIRPHEKTQVISLIRDAAIDVNPMGSFAADELHIWVLEVAADDARASGSTAKGGKGKSAIVPDRLLALGSVKVDSPQLIAQTGRLEAWFVDRPQLAGDPLMPAGNAGLPPLAGRPAPIRPPVAGPTATGQPAGGAPQQFSVIGERVQMQIARAGEKTALEDLTIQGGMQIQETRTAAAGESPLKITGETLQLRDGASDNAKLEVRGKPAEVSARGLTMSGPTIHLHRGENKLWIDGPGKATLPVPQERKIDPPPAEPDRMNVFWQRSMHFDGATATLIGEVQATSKTQRALSETLEVTLAQPVNFAKPEQRGATEIARLKFDGGVDLENTTLDELGERTSTERMQVRNLLVDRISGALLAEGPGWLTSIRKGDPAGLMVGQPGAPVPVAPIAPTDGEGLTHLHIEFQGGITGNLNNHEVSFQRLVKTIYANVNDWDARITMKDLDERGLAALGEKGALLSSDRLTVREMGAGGRSLPGQKWMELEATGDTLVEGSSFTARSERISYTTDKEQLVLQGDGRNDAELWHQQVKGGQYSYTAATKILYWRKNNEVKLEGGKVLDLQQLQSAKPLPTRRRR